MKHYTILVKGKVQGVWYRKSAMEKAMELGIKGVVRNQPNGNVYIEAEGEENQLSIFLEWCFDGPEFAKVYDVSYKEEAMMDYSFFEIVY